MILSSFVPITLFLPWWLLVPLVLLVIFLVWLFHWPGRNVPVKLMWASKFSPELVPPGPLDAIVIGSGVGGCACSNLLAQAGKKVLLLEQHEERSGGCTHTFRQENCEFDSGLQYTSEGMGLPTHRSGGLMRFITGGKQEWKRLTDPYDHIFFPEDDNVAEVRRFHDGF